jgi:predicted O-methyltransferase YrrM
LTTVKIPQDLDVVLQEAGTAAEKVPGHLGENEIRFLGLLAACTPGQGAIVEIGSFKGRSTVMLAKVASHYGRGPVSAIDPHNSPILVQQGASSYEEFQKSIRGAGLEKHVEAHVAYSEDVAKSWNRPIRLLWIDGDHTYEGAKKDLDGFLPHLVPYGVVAFHDALNAFPGPIRVFVEDVLRSDQFGAAGFVHSIAWAQYRPEDGKAFRDARLKLAKRATKLIPFVENGEDLRGLKKRCFKWNRFRVPHAAIEPREWASVMNRLPPG